MIRLAQSASRRWGITGFAILILLGAAGCSTVHVAPLVEDHTIGLISRPISGPVELVWRVKTFSTETVGRMGTQFIAMPRLDSQPIPPLQPGHADTSRESFRSWLAKETGPSVKGALTLLINGDAYFTRLDQALRGATNSIDIQTYIFDNDDVALGVANLLKEKSRQIPVRVLFDGIGSRTAWQVQAPSATNVPQPDIPSMARYLKTDSAIAVQRGFNLWLSTDHSKIIVVDHRLAFFGGMNIGREYRYDWRDLMVEVQGPLVQEFERLFQRAWKRSKTFSDFWVLFDRHRRRHLDPAAPGAACYVVLTTPFTHDIYDAQLRAAQLAVRRIYVENSYLWNDKYIYALCEARKRGVDVRVVLPLNVNIPIGHGANRVAVNTLLRHGARVFLYPGMTHVKAALYDGWAAFGTANFDDLSLHKNIEINLFTDDPAFVKTFEEQLLLDGQDQCIELKDSLPAEAWDQLSKDLANFL